VKHLLVISALGSLGAVPVLHVRDTDNASQDILVVERYPSHACYFNSLLPSLDGTGVIVSQNNGSFQDERDFRNRTSFVVISGLPLLNQSLSNLKPRTHIIGSKSGRVRPLFWSNQGLLFRVGGKKLYNARLEGEWKFEPRAMNAAWANVEITINSPRGILAIDDKNNIRTAENIGSNNKFRRQSAYLSDKSFFSAVDVKNQQKLLIGRDENSLSSIGQSAFFYNFNVLSAKNIPILSYYGNISSKEWKKFNKKYSNDIINFGNGEIEGIFRPDEIQLRNIVLSNNFQNYTSEFSYKNVAYVNGRTFVLASNFQGHSIFFFDKKNPGDWAEIQLCENKLGSKQVQEGKEGSNKNLLPTPSLIGAPLSEKFHTTGILFRSSAPKKAGLILYFHGGPAVTSNVHSVPWELTRLFDSGYDVLAVEYSGSVGGGLPLSEGLATKPDFGFAEDANAIYEWLSNQNYAEVHSYSESFGTFPALYFARKYNGYVKKRIYAAPVLKYPNYDLIGASTRFDRIEAKAQLEFEKGIYGGDIGRARFIEFVSESASAHKATLNDLFIFGTYDNVAPIENAPQHILVGANILKVRREHAFLTADESTLNSIYLHIMN
jgi:pimeloyl-ACP methyl ester carboxylesterase